MADIKQTGPNALSVKIAEYFGIVAIALFLAILLVGYVFLFAPALRKLQQANLTQLLNQEITAKKKHLADLQALKANYDKIPADDVANVLRWSRSRTTCPA